MKDLLLGNPALAAFLAASLVLAATPGPGVLYILARTVALGRRAGLSSVAGVAMGNLANALGASIGLAALLAISPWALSVVKYAGAVYLVYLGVKGLAEEQACETVAFMASDRARIFVDGFVVAVLNPKTALFFAAFLPQFIDPAASAMLQSVLLGALFVVVALVTDSLYVLTASAVRPALAHLRWLRRSARYLSAGVLIGLGCLAALSGPGAP